MAFYGSIHAVKCGDIVREIDGRHEARVQMITKGNNRPIFLKLKWLDSGWISENVPVDGLEIVEIV